MENVGDLIKKSIELLLEGSRDFILPTDLDEDIITFLELDSMDTLTFISNLEKCSGLKIDLHKLKKYNYILSINSITYLLENHD
ncbi:hypothetical protein CL656_04950 [bacterium]|nr:hypothetical protein [bacterium]|tara:strand:+ start:372 stop:623 length:252 start_codon:yes stop_codon:yes gene_type:complete